MRCEKSGFRVVGIFSLVIVFSVAVTAWCATNRGAGEERRITDLNVLENSDSLDLMVKGNRLLTYTSFKQPFPLTLILYFSGTVLDAPVKDFSPKSDVVRSINASQVIEKKYTSKIEIALKKDVRHVISRDGNTLRVSFASTPKVASDAGGKYEATRSLSASAMPAETSDTATRLQSVYAARLEDSLKVFVGADGVITNYKSFVIESPARIIFDIFNIKSPYENEKLIPVNTKWVKRVRYYGYPDRLRVVLDTRREYLTAFAAVPIENGLLIHVGTDTAFETGLASRSFSETEKSAGTNLQSVYATQLEDCVLVTVKADGPITEYKPSTTRNPPGIVLDIYGVGNPYEKDKSFPVDAKWVKRVRQKTYGDKVQIVIDTYEQYLSDFTTYPEKNGLVVRVGKKGAAVAAKEATKTPPPSERTYDRSKPAWVNRIDFLSEDAGKSALVIGTTRQIDYDMIKESDRSLRLKIFGARIPRYRQRPLITDRFESAVDKIMPVHKPAMKNTSLFEIELREAVPHFVEQADNILTVHFEASSISPKPMVSADLPSWKNVLAEDTAAESAKIAEPPVISVPGADTLPQAADVPVPTEMALAETTGLDDFPGGITPPESGGISDSWRSGQKKRYTGEKIALDFYKTDIKNVFRILREVSGKNFAIEKDVTGEVTLTLDKPVPWDQVLDLILKMNKLGMTEEGDIIRIATRATLDAEEEERRAAEAERLELEKQIKESEVELAETKTVYIPVSYSDAENEIKPHIEKILSDRGSMSVDTRTNTIILTDTEEKVKHAYQLVEKLDKVTPQVLIEARIVEASINFSRNIGIYWSANAGIGNYDTDAGYGPQRGYDVLGGTYGYDMSVNLPRATDGQFSFNFLRLAGSPLTLAATIAAEESNGTVKTISTPKIVTLDNKTASISQGFSYPYQRIVDGTVSELEKDVSLTLNVTPHVTPDNRITLKIDISKEDTGSMVNDRMTFLKKDAETELLVNDGETVVIGGVLQIVENESSAGIPGLSKIPLLGWLFKNRGYEDRKEELLIFITPKIVQLEQKLSF